MRLNSIDHRYQTLIYAALLLCCSGHLAAAQSSATASISSTVTLSRSITESKSATDSMSLTRTVSRTQTLTRTGTLSASPTNSLTPTESATVSISPSHHCNPACADGTCTALGGGLGTCIGACAHGYLPAASPSTGCTVAMTLSFYVQLISAGACSGNPSPTTGPFLTSVASTTSISTSGLNVTAVNCTTQSTSTGVYYSWTIALTALNLPAASEIALEDSLTTLPARLQHAPLGNEVMDVVSVQIGRVSSLCYASCRTCTDLGPFDCASCGPNATLASNGLCISHLLPSATPLPRSAGGKPSAARIVPAVLLPLCAVSLLLLLVYRYQRGRETPLFPSFMRLVKGTAWSAGQGKMGGGKGREGRGEEGRKEGGRDVVKGGAVQPEDGGKVDHVIMDQHGGAFGTLLQGYMHMDPSRPYWGSPDSPAARQRAQLESAAEAERRGRGTMPVVLGSHQGWAPVTKGRRSRRSRMSEPPCITTADTNSAWMASLRTPSPVRDSPRRKPLYPEFPRPVGREDAGTPAVEGVSTRSQSPRPAERRRSSVVVDGKQSRSQSTRPPEKATAAVSERKRAHEKAGAAVLEGKQPRAPSEKQVERAAALDGKRAQESEGRTASSVSALASAVTLDNDVDATRRRAARRAKEQWNRYEERRASQTPTAGATPRRPEALLAAEIRKHLE